MSAQTNELRNGVAKVISRSPHQHEHRVLGRPRVGPAVRSTAPSQSDDQREVILGFGSRTALSARATVGNANLVRYGLRR